MDPRQLVVALIEQFEGLRLHAYKDVGGVLTIGYGSTENVHPDTVITKEQAIDMLLKHLEPMERQLKGYLKVSLNATQTAALLDFGYNCGMENLRTSTLLKKVNAGDFQAAANEFKKWDKVNGKPILGLTRRREAERILFLK